MWNPLKVVLPGMRVGDLHYSLFRPEHSSLAPVAGRCVPGARSLALAAGTPLPLMLASKGVGLLHAGGCPSERAGARELLVACRLGRKD